jgi:hypothetical protein
LVILIYRLNHHVVVISKEIGLSLRQRNEEWFPEEKMVLISLENLKTYFKLSKSSSLENKTGTTGDSEAESNGNGKAVIK